MRMRKLLEAMNMSTMMNSLKTYSASLDRNSRELTQRSSFVLPTRIFITFIPFPNHLIRLMEM
jgi:hypothetical protein